MKYTHKIVITLFTVCTLVMFSGCEKFLAEKADQKLVLPERLEDLQALLDYLNDTNLTGVSAGSASSDDYYLSNQRYNALAAENDRRMHTWEKDNLFSTTGFNSWRDVYASVYCANTVLEGLDKIPRTPGNAAAWDNLKGQALFLRGFSFLDAAVVWCIQYNTATANKDLGLPLRLNTDFNEVSKRSNLQQTYDQILADLKETPSLLPVVALSKHRSSKIAAYGLLARAYLVMGNYDEALLQADNCLKLQGDLLDYSKLDAAATFPITIAGNPEFLYAKYINYSPLLASSNAIIPDDLYRLYTANDLRKTVFFGSNTDGSLFFKGGYFGADGPNAAPCTDEVYLIRAECLARNNQVELAVKDLNTLLKTRWKVNVLPNGDRQSTYVDYTTTDREIALNLILTERRKELIMRGTRWTDIKRLNKEGANISLSRTLNGKTYTLPANDLRFALPIPEDVIALSGMEQNLR